MIGTTLPLPLRARPPERMALAFVAPAGLQQFPHPFLRRPTTDCKLFKASPLDPAPPGAVPSRAANAFCPQGGPRRQLISSGGPPPPFLSLSTARRSFPAGYQRRWIIGSPQSSAPVACCTSNALWISWIILSLSLSLALHSWLALKPSVDYPGAASR